MGKLLADQFQNDPRLKEAYQLIRKAAADYQGKIKTIKPPDPLLKRDYEELANLAKERRGASLWFPYIGSGLGNGPFVELADGSVKLDLINGIGVHYDHGPSQLLEAKMQAATSDLVMQGNIQMNREAIALLDELSQAVSLPHCFLTTSGAMAVENALKMAFQKHFPKKRLLAFRNGFHGRTLTLASITDRPKYREGLPHLMEVDYLPFAPGDALEALEHCLKEHPGEYAAFLFEPIQGEGGINLASSEFFLPLLKQMRKEGIAIIADEIQTFGRTEKLLASQSLGLMDQVDIVTIGKLGQVCATLYTADYNPRPGLLSQTFISSTSAINAARVVLQKLMTHEEKKGQIHRYLKEGLKRLKPKISGPYGTGLMGGFTIDTGEQALTEKFVRRLYENGVITFIAGENPCRVRLLLPPCIEEFHLDLALSLIEKTLAEVAP